MKKTIWRRIFVLPLIPTLFVMAAAAVLMVLAFQWRLFDLRGAAIYMFATYALILAITNYIRMMRELSGTDHQILIGGYKSQYRVRSRALNGLLASILIPFFQVVVISFSYVMTQSIKGAVTGKAGRIILAVFSVIAMLLLVVLGPLFFWVGVACILWWSGQAVRGIALCAVGLVLIVLSAHIIRRMSERQKEEILRDFTR